MKSRSVFTIGFVLLAVALLLAPGPVLAQAGGANEEVQTVAGNGRAGIEDGAAANATFLFPVGIAVAESGVYIADQNAQRIRVLRNGSVSTLAGSGALERDGLSVLGGYRDGPAAQARFNLPAGVAVGPDGAVYVADSGNACIRKIDRGTVSTLLGKPGQSKATDGDAATGRLVSPRGLAFDKAGDLYIADYGGGLRVWGRDGRLRTVSKTDPRIYGVSADTADSDGVIYASSPVYVIAYRPRDKSEDHVSAGVMGEAGPIGNAYGLAALNHREVLFTDPKSNDLRYMRFGIRPFVNGTFTRTIAGGILASGLENAGARDGSRAAARFFTPTGVAIQGGAALVADAGNRRIRRVSLPSFRKTEAGLEDNVPTDKRHFEIVYIGASASFYDSLGDDSICGQIEATLNASHRIDRPVRCRQVRIDGPSLNSFLDYITTFIAPRSFDLVLLQMSSYEVGGLDPTKTKKIPELVPVERAKVQQIVDALKPTHTKLGLMWAYTGGQVSAAEFFLGREGATAMRDLPLDEYYWHKTIVMPLIEGVQGLDVLNYDSYGDLLSYEGSKSAVPLWNTVDDIHPTSRFNIFFGKKIADYLLSLPAKALTAMR